MEQQQLFKIRDRRKKGWFFMDNEYLNGYAKIFGAVGTAIYVSLCRHSDNETQICFPSMDLMAEELAISRPTIIKYLKMFKEYKIIAITKEKDARGRQKNNIYLLLDKEEWIPSKDILHGEPSKTILHTRVKLTEKSRVKPFYHKDTNKLIKDTHIKDTNDEAGKPAIINQDEKIINDLIKLFEPINPSYEKLYANKTQRESLRRMVKKWGVEKVIGMIQALPNIISQKFAPRATTPYQLEDKLGELRAFSQQQRSQKSKIGMV